MHKRHMSKTLLTYAFYRTIIYIRKARREQFMPRPVKCRKVCHFPNVLEFFPSDENEKKTPIVLTVDEYETIRLLDKKGYSQEQCEIGRAHV